MVYEVPLQSDKGPSVWTNYPPKPLYDWQNGRAYYRPTPSTTCPSGWALDDGSHTPECYTKSMTRLKQQLEEADSYGLTRRHFHWASHGDAGKGGAAVKILNGTRVVTDNEEDFVSDSPRWRPEKRIKVYTPSHTHRMNDLTVFQKAGSGKPVAVPLTECASGYKIEDADGNTTCYKQFVDEGQIMSNVDAFVDMEDDDEMVYDPLLLMIGNKTHSPLALMFLPLAGDDPHGYGDVAVFMKKIPTNVSGNTMIPEIVLRLSDMGHFGGKKGQFLIVPLTEVDDAGSASIEGDVFHFQDRPELNITNMDPMLRSPVWYYNAEVAVPPVGEEAHSPPSLREMGYPLQLDVLRGGPAIDCAARGNHILDHIQRARDIIEPNKRFYKHMLAFLDQLVEVFVLSDPSQCEFAEWLGGQFHFEIETSGGELEDDPFSRRSRLFMPYTPERTRGLVFAFRYIWGNKDKTMHLGPTKWDEIYQDLTNGSKTYVAEEDYGRFDAYWESLKRPVEATPTAVLPVGTIGLGEDLTKEGLEAAWQKQVAAKVFRNMAYGQGDWARYVWSTLLFYDKTTSNDGYLALLDMEAFLRGLSNSDRLLIFEETVPIMNDKVAWGGARTYDLYKEEEERTDEDNTVPEYEMGDADSPGMTDASPVGGEPICIREVDGVYRYGCEVDANNGQVKFPLAGHLAERVREGRVKYMEILYGNITNGNLQQDLDQNLSYTTEEDVVDTINGIKQVAHSIGNMDIEEFKNLAWFILKMAISVRSLPTYHIRGFKELMDLPQETQLLAKMALEVYEPYGKRLHIEDPSYNSMFWLQGKISGKHGPTSDDPLQCLDTCCWYNPSPQGGSVLDTPCVVIAFRGTTFFDGPPPKEWAQWFRQLARSDGALYADFNLLKGTLMDTKKFDAARSFYARVHAHFNNNRRGKGIRKRVKIYVTGHSLGGMLAMNVLAQQRDIMETMTADGPAEWGEIETIEGPNGGMIPSPENRRPVHRAVVFNPAICADPEYIRLANANINTSLATSYVPFLHTTPFLKMEVNPWYDSLETHKIGGDDDAIQRSDPISLLAGGCGECYEYTGPNIKSGIEAHSLLNFPTRSVLAIQHVDAAVPDSSA